MAQLLYRNGFASVTFDRPSDGERKTMSFGRMSKRAAETVRGHVSALVNAAKSNTQVSDMTAFWVSGLGQKMHDKLVAHGLMKPRTAVVLPDTVPVVPERMSRPNSVDLWFTYFFRSGDGPIKIGRATNISRRLCAIQAYNPEPVECIGYKRGDHEAKLHGRFAGLRLHGEWFTPATELLDFIRTETIAWQP